MKNKPDSDATGKERFIAAATELECNMTQEEFAKTLKGISSVKPMTQEDLKKSKKEGQP